MVFPTLSYVLFFAVVLAGNLALFRLAGWRKAFLLASSFFFYAVWDVRFLALMGGVIVLAWIGGRAALLAPTRARLVRAASIAGLLACLGFFKYFNFFLLSFEQLLGTAGLSRDMAWAQVVLPVGISFYTFQAISYVVDTARGQADPRTPFHDVALYISFFPQLVAGPIVRASTFLSQIDRPVLPDAGLRAEAVVLILAGLFKKLVIANYLATKLVDPAWIDPTSQNALSAWAAVLAYSAQIYCDFSGYSDIAIGCALLLGYRFPPNFNQPYRSASFREFWRRWHISLSTWIRDYLYIPLGGSRGTPLRNAAVVIFVMTVAGLWHGAAWTFVIWGMGHGLLLWAERGLTLPFTARALRIAPVFLIVTLLWLPFRAGSFEAAAQMAAALFRPEGLRPVTVELSVIVLFCLGMAFSLAPPSWAGRASAALSRLNPPLQAALFAILLFLCFALGQEGVAPFIYFQF